MHKVKVRLRKVGEGRILEVLVNEEKPLPFALLSLSPQGGVYLEVSTYGTTVWKAEEKAPDLEYHFYYNVSKDVIKTLRTKTKEQLNIIYREDKDNGDIGISGRYDRRNFSNFVGMAVFKSLRLFWGAHIAGKTVGEIFSDVCPKEVYSYCE